MTHLCDKGAEGKPAQAAEEAASGRGGPEGVESFKWEGKQLMRPEGRRRVSNLRGVVSLMDSD